MNAHPSLLAALLCPRRVLGLALAGLLLPGVVHADKIVTTGGQSLEGVISDQNNYYVTIIVEGVSVPVPRDRIQSIQTQSPTANARMLLDKASAAVEAKQLSTARALIEQTRLLNVKDADVIDGLRALDRKVTDMEEHGATPEERRRRSSTLLNRAAEAYDRIRIEEGDELLIQSLKADPTNPAARDLVQQHLKKNGEPNQLLIARYYGDVLAQSGVPDGSPVIPYLPGAYQDMVSRFGSTKDLQLAANISNWMQAIYDGIKAHPAWLASANAEQRALLDRPINEVRAEQVDATLRRGDSEAALSKLKDFAQPNDSAEVAELYARAYVALGQFDAADKILTDAQEQFPNVSNLRLQANALTLIARGMQALDSGNQEVALNSLQQVFNSAAGLPPEYNQAIGQRLAVVLAPQLGQPAPEGEPWRPADIAALVMRYGKDAELRRHAAQSLSTALYQTPWDINFNVQINGVDLPLSQPQRQMAASSLADVLAVKVDPNSTFRVTILMNMKMSDDDAQRLANALGKESSARLSPPAEVDELSFDLKATQSSLDQLLTEEWKVDQVPDAVAKERQARMQQNATSGTLAAGAGQPTTATMPTTATAVATPAPTPAASAANPLAANPLAAPPAAATAAAPSTPTVSIEMSGPLPQPTSGSVVLKIGSPEDVTGFLKDDLGGMVPAQATLLTAHIEIPMMKSLLTDKVILK